MIAARPNKNYIYIKSIPDIPKKTFDRRSFLNFLAEYKFKIIKIRKNYSKKPVPWRNGFF